MGQVDIRVDFFIAGAQKAGTTALWESLRRHDALQLPTAKEVHFFDNEDVNWAQPDYTPLHQHFDGAQKVRGEATPIYIYWPNALGRLRVYNPAAKIIVALRHPAFRAYSHWRMETMREDEALSFSAAIREGRARVRGAAGGVHRAFSYVERGYYDEQIARLLALFPREQTYFVRTDELFTKPEQTFVAIERFLGVPHQSMASVGYVVPLRTDIDEPMRAQDRALLDAEYGPRYTAIERQTGLDLSDWRDPGYCEPMRPS
jgi:hypothetical protein